MTTMNSEIYDALVAAKVPEDKARAAAESVAAYDNRFTKFNEELINVRSDISVLRWMVAANITLSVAILARLFVR